MTDNEQKMKCIVCGRVIEDTEQYACVWADSDVTATVIGFAHLPCSDTMEDITDEVIGDSP